MSVVRDGLRPGPRYPRALQALGGGVRPMALMERCHGRGGDMFTLVLAALVRSVQLRPERPEGERVARRAITLSPARGAAVVVTRHERAGASASARSPAEVAA